MLGLHFVLGVIADDKPEFPSDGVGPLRKGEATAEPIYPLNREIPGHCRALLSQHRPIFYIHPELPGTNSGIQFTTTPVGIRQRHALGWPRHLAPFGFILVQILPHKALFIFR